MPAPVFQQKFTIEQRLLTSGSKRRPGLRISPGVKFVVAHDTGNPGSSAAANVRYYENSRDVQSASAHIFVDDKQILECIPALGGPPEKAWHVLYQLATDDRMFGYNANDAAIGVEYCYGPGIDADAAYRRYVWVIAFICHKFGLNPAESVVGHCFLDPTRKTDPVTGLARSRRTYEQLLRDIPAEHVACLQVGDEVPAPAPAAATDTAAGSVQVTSRLNVRKAAPTRLADVVRTVLPGTRLDYVACVPDGEPVNGNRKWFRDADGNFFWSGATVP